jgi:SAM-dependent methyltransferase
VSLSRKDWIQSYQTVLETWNLEPDWTLLEYHPVFSEGMVLDLGMGNGRNALFFAKMGFEVECVDTSKTAVKKCRERANAEHLPVVVHQIDIRSFEIPRRQYSLILVSKVLQFFVKSEIETLSERIFDGLTKRGCVYLRVFSPAEYKYYIRDKRETRLIEPNTYYIPRYNLHYHFFTKEEVLQLFSKLKTLHCIEGLESDLRYKKPRKEWIIEYIGQRTR